jgi:hypothetical protein
MSQTPNLDELMKPENGEALVRTGAEMYNTRLKALLEPEHNNEYVAVHVGSGDYYIARTATAAIRKLGEQHPSDGLMFVRKIGDEPEYGLAARLSGKDTAFGANK